MPTGTAIVESAPKETLPRHSPRPVEIWRKAPPSLVPVPESTVTTGRQLKAPLSSKVAFVPTATLPVPIAFVLEFSCTHPRST